MFLLYEMFNISKTSLEPEKGENIKITETACAYVYASDWNVNVVE